MNEQGQPNVRHESLSLITGGEAIARLLRQFKFDIVYAYPGTSELALCAAIAAQSGIQLKNSRGDREAVFFSIGHGLIKPSDGVALLHGARGSTNALGAIASARRNEVGILVLVGLPSRESQRFLPPHGEVGLIEGLGRFAKASFDLSGNFELTATFALDFLARFCQAISQLRRPPLGPVIVGLPQDLLERNWIPSEIVEARAILPRIPYGNAPAAAEQVWKEIEAAVGGLIFFVDDLIFRDSELVRNISLLADHVGADVFQTSYLRGPMLFQRYGQNRPSSYASYDPRRPSDVSRMQAARLIITFEDRNMYERIVGKLPRVRKIGLTSNVQITRKNGYADDSLVSCDVGEVVRDILSLAKKCSLRRAPKADKLRGEESQALKAGAVKSILDHFAAAIRRTPGAIIVDDSQMFGGIISRYYDEIISNERVFGDHSGFVGGGIGTAIGVALAKPGTHVWCLCGDQGFANGFQALLFGVEVECGLTIVVFNNGGSASLIKQMRSTNRSAAEYEQSILGNGPVSPSAIAKAIGCWSEQVNFCNEIVESSEALDVAFQHAVAEFRAKVPHLIEIIAPAEPDVWSDVWLTEGFDAETPRQDEKLL